MPSSRSVLFLIVCGFSLATLGQAGGRESVSSDDISVADGLQLPTYGHVWALDHWKGLPELVRLRPPDAPEESGMPFKSRRGIAFKGEAATVRIHKAPSFFVRGVSGADNGRSDLVAVRLTVEGERRQVPKEAMAQLKPRGKHDETPDRDVVEMKQERIGSTDWYRVTPLEDLAPGEYALIPVSTSAGFAEGEIFDFAVDPQAGENANPLRSEQYRNVQ
jgi:hypothetical protein